MDWAISSSSASITGAVAAMAEPPHMDEPTPISVATFDGTLNSLNTINATISDVAIVDIIIGSEDIPTFPTVARLRPKPSSTTAACRIFLEV